METKTMNPLNEPKHLFEDRRYREKAKYELFMNSTRKEKDEKIEELLFKETEDYDNFIKRLELSGGYDKYIKGLLNSLIHKPFNISPYYLTDEEKDAILDEIKRCITDLYWCHVAEGNLTFDEYYKLLEEALTNKEAKDERKR